MNGIFVLDVSHGEMATYVSAYYALDNPIASLTFCSLPVLVIVYGIPIDLAPSTASLPPTWELSTSCTLPSGLWTTKYAWLLLNACIQIISSPFAIFPGVICLITTHGVVTIATRCPDYGTRAIF